MLFNPKHGSSLNRLAEKLRLAPAVTSELFSAIITESWTRLPVLKRAGKADRLDQLIQAGAWTDASLALIDLEMPAWKLRRLVYEDGEWHCSLSKQPSLPSALDDTADASHQELPLAVLSAFAEARLREASTPDVSMPSFPQVRSDTDYRISCENYF
jgi:hypothetical protein